MPIYVGNLPRTVTAGEVERLFSQYGKVGKVMIKGNGAYVDMADDAQAGLAIRRLENAKYGNQDFKCR